MTEPMVLLELAAAVDDEAARAEAQQVTHDRILALLVILKLRQAGPVKWSWYGADAAPGILRDAGLEDHPNAAGVRRFLEETPDALLLVAAVPYDAPANPAVRTGDA